MIIHKLHSIFLPSSAVNVRFGRPNVTVTEDDGEFMMCVVKDRVTAVPVIVTISTSDGTAIESSGKSRQTLI